MKLRTVVAQNLRRMRYGKGMSQEELAAQAGLYRTYVGHLEREVHSPTVDMLEKLAKILDVAPTDFFIDPPPPMRWQRSRIARSVQRFEPSFAHWDRSDYQAQGAREVFRLCLRDCPARCVNRDDVARRVAIIGESHAGYAFPVLDLLPVASARTCYVRTVTGLGDMLVAHAGLPGNLPHGHRPDQSVQLLAGHFH
jgi:transcriptional regulator with XRE-family HTH domain